jgi:hypothetical protein
MKKWALREILGSTYYIRVLCSTDGMVYYSSGPSLKERSKYGAGLSSKTLNKNKLRDNLEPAEVRREGEADGEANNLSSHPNSPCLKRAFIPIDKPSTGGLENCIIIKTPTLGRQRAKEQREGSSLSSFKPVYQHPNLLPLRTDTALV